MDAEQRIRVIKWIRAEFDDVVEDVVGGFRTGFYQLDTAPELKVNATVTSDQRELLRSFLVDAPMGRALRAVLQHRIDVALVSVLSMIDGIGGPIGPSDLVPRAPNAPFNWHDDFYRDTPRSNT